MSLPPASKTPHAIAEALARAITPEQIARALADGLTATSVSRSGCVEADTRSRLQAASLILAYQVGRPVERQEIINVNLDADAAAGMEDRLRNSPALRETLRKLLQRAESVDVA